MAGQPWSCTHLHFSTLDRPSSSSHLHWLALVVPKGFWDFHPISLPHSLVVPPASSRSKMLFSIHPSIHPGVQICFSGLSQYFLGPFATLGLLGQAESIPNWFPSFFGTCSCHWFVIPSLKWHSLSLAPGLASLPNLRLAKRDMFRTISRAPLHVGTHPAMTPHGKSFHCWGNVLFALMLIELHSIPSSGATYPPPRVHSCLHQV